MEKHESRLKREKETSYTTGFVKGVECTKEIITNELKDAIKSRSIIITKGSDRIFKIINSVGNIRI